MFDNNHTVGHVVVFQLTVALCTCNSSLVRRLFLCYFTVEKNNFRPASTT